MLRAHTSAIGAARVHRAKTVQVFATTTSAPSMAWSNAKTGKRDARPENVAGDFYVDHTCIGANTHTRLLMHAMRAAAELSHFEIVL